MKAKIILFEDEKDVRESIIEILVNNDFEAITLKTDTNFLERIIFHKPDLIISDIMMPGIDGYQLKRKLDSNKKTSSIPFIFLTAKAEMQDLRMGMNIGADDYLIKPFKTKDLLQAVEIRLKKAVGFESKPIKNDSQDKFKYEDRIFVDLKDKQMFIKLSEIKFIQSEGAYTTVVLVDDKKYLIRKLLKEWESVLPQENFIRIHRGTIINLEYVVKLEKWFNRTYKVYLSGSTDALDISQRFAVKLKSKLSF